MYQKIINELNLFLDKINMPSNPINPDEFQGVFVKKLSNQNIIKDKRRINAGDAVSTVNQTHIDITGRQSMLFFFESLNAKTTSVQNIDIDLYDNNYKYLNEIDTAHAELDHKGHTYFVRSSVSVPAHLNEWNKIIHSSAYKKYGHTGDQIQINIPDSDEFFTKFQHLAFQDDALVLLKYDYLHYLAILVPSELCDILYSITNTHGNQNVNVPVINPSYNEKIARQIQRNEITRDLMYDEIDMSILQSSLNNSPTAGTDITKMVKTRVSQGAFRRLLLLERHQCQLCNITTTSVLRASHIKEWSESTKEERMDAENGLLLCANHDVLFDRHLISFDPEYGNICISESLGDQQRESLQISDSLNIEISDRMKTYMKLHYQKFKDKENL